jgi:hypothetical protein
LCAAVPWIGRIMFSPWVLKLMGPKEGDETGVGMLMGVAKKIAGERFGPQAVDGKDMLV